MAVSKQPSAGLHTHVCVWITFSVTSSGIGRKQLCQDVRVPRKRRCRMSSLSSGTGRRRQADNWAASYQQTDGNWRGWSGPGCNATC